MSNHTLDLIFFRKPPTRRYVWSDVTSFIALDNKIEIELAHEPKQVRFFFYRLIRLYAPMCTYLAMPDRLIKYLMSSMNVEYID